jgi:hypothetical protein
MTRLKKSSLVLLLAFISISLRAQDPYAITMEISKAESKDEQVNGMMQMLVGSQTKIITKDKKAYIELDILGGMMRLKRVSDPSNKENTTLIDMMGQKMWLSDPIKEDNSPDNNAGFEITYNKENKKTIEGYECYEFEFKSKENADMTIKGFLTEKIKINVNFIQGMAGIKLSGTPLEYSILSSDLSLVMTAKSITNTVSDSQFKLDTTGYNKMSSEEFFNQLGPMGDMLKF